MTAKDCDYYVYIHRHPISQQDLYVGYGRADRAYRTLSHQKNAGYSDRHPDHSKDLKDLLDEGYLPHEWVIFDSKYLTRKEAQQRERELIKELRPKHNRKPGLDFKLTNEQVKLVKELREQKKTYDEMASEVNCSRTTIYRIITNKRGVYIGR